MYNQEKAAAMEILPLEISPIYTFFEFIGGGTQLHCCFAIDFTGTHIYMAYVLSGRDVLILVDFSPQHPTVIQQILLPFTIFPLSSIKQTLTSKQFKR
jgi:hypothetical protein